MVGESWIVFIIRVLVEKHISGPRPLLRPFANALAQLVKNTSLIQSATG